MTCSAFTAEGVYIQPYDASGYSSNLCILMISAVSKKTKGGNKVVDEKGEPITVYHTTKVKNISELMDEEIIKPNPHDKCPLKKIDKIELSNCE